MTTTRAVPPPLADLGVRWAELEAQKNAIAAQQADIVLAAARAHVEERIAAGVTEPEALERTVADRVGRMCRCSPTQARRRVQIARDLRQGLTRVRELFVAGLLDDHKLAIIVAATGYLDPDERAQVDAELSAQQVERLGVRRIHDLTRTLAAQVAPEKFAQRARAARSGRRVSIRPSREEGMADLIAHLPVEQAVACHAALRKAVNDVWCDPEPVHRGQGQIMADTLVERVTGQATASDVNVEVQVLLPVEALLDPDSPLPAEVPGYGPIPVDLLATTAGRTAWRRLITRDGIIIGGDSRARTFTGVLAHLIRMRDGGRCTAPYCDAPIAQFDHITRWRHGGPTTFDNGRGYCAFHNHTREIGTTAGRPFTQRAGRPAKGVPSRIRPPGRPYCSRNKPRPGRTGQKERTGNPARAQRDGST